MKTAHISKAGGRKYNEDYCSYLEQGGYGCYVLADGLGGHRGGAVASRVIGESILKAFQLSPGISAGLLSAYLERAHSVFLAEQEKDSLLAGMKSTLVVLLSDYNKIFWGHIGDSRLYLFRAGKALIQTSDHSVPRHLADSGDIKEEQIRFHEDRNRLTKAFDGGSIERFEMAEEPVELKHKDAILLCTDGFWEYVIEKEMLSDLALTDDPAFWLETMENRLIKKADSGNDNYSAVAIINI